LADIKEVYHQDKQAVALLQQLSLASDSVPHFWLRDGLLRYNGVLLIPVVPELQQKIVHALHLSPAGGHSGVPVTLRRVRQLFYWRGMKKAVKQLVQDM
jgi:hypothetical protein